MITIKIKPSHPSQGDYVVINVSDFDPQKHELLDGESLGDASGDIGDGAPTLAELIASRNQLLARNDQLDDLELSLNQRAGALDDREQLLVGRETAVTEREQANIVEAQRLADEKAAIAKAVTPAGSAEGFSTASTGGKAKK